MQNAPRILIALVLFTLLHCCPTDSLWVLRIHDNGDDCVALFCIENRLRIANRTDSETCPGLKKENCKLNGYFEQQFNESRESINQEKGDGPPY